MDDSREVIELVNRLQSSFKTTGLQKKVELPQIVVVGAQSSGKSSVLDGLVGFSILPRGSGTVTKCPIIVQLITISDRECEGIEFEDYPESGRISDHDKVRSMISDLMSRNNGAITETPIIVRVYSPKVVTLTVVDLPGVKRLTCPGEPSDLESLIINLSKKYISSKNSIILAVSPANYEICNSDGLMLAQDADKGGDRTIGVLTKLDLMDEGTDARELLTGTSKDVKVKLGMIGLVNRSQKDIDHNLTVEEQLVKEKVFLAKNYPDLSDVNGVPYLRQKLSELLVFHIKKCLPEILESLNKQLGDCEKHLKEIPDILNEHKKKEFVNNVIIQFESGIRTEIEGSTRNPETEYLYGGIEIKDIFENDFAVDMEDLGKRSDALIKDKQIINAFRNSGSFDTMFVYPEAVFRRLAQDQVKLIKESALKCAENVHDKIIDTVNRNLRGGHIDLFPELRKAIQKVVHSMMAARLEELNQQIEDYMRVQASVVFSLDKQFLRKLADIRRELEKHLHSTGGETGSDDDEVDAIRNLPSVPRYAQLQNGFDSGDQFFSRLKHPSTSKLIKEMVALYFEQIKCQTQDYVPKLVADRLISQFAGDGRLGFQLRSKVLENFEELAVLPHNLSERRERYAKMRKCLKEVSAEIKGILAGYDYHRMHSPVTFSHGNDNADVDCRYNGHGRVTVRFCNLPESATEADIDKMCSRFGKIGTIFLSKDSDAGSGHVTYYNKEDASRFLRYFNEKGCGHMISDI